MATKRKYAYYIKGNKIALIQREDALVGSNNSEYGMYKSPTESIADGLEIQYTYVPDYLIESTDTSTTTISGWDQDNDGNFRLRASGSTNWTSSPNLSSVTYIVLKNAGRWNGLHKVSSVTNNRIVTTTKISASTSETLFEETVSLYYDVNPLNDESDELPVPPYLERAIVDYLKARIAEDQGEIEMKEYYLREFRRKVEKHESSKIRGYRAIVAGPHALR